MEETSPTFEAALGYLSRKSRTVYEVRAYLEKKQFAGKHIEAAVEKLKSYGYLDDKAYLTSAYKENYRGKRFGKRRLLENLRRKGISEAGLKAFGAAYPQAVEEACLDYHLQKLLTKHAGQSYFSKKQKMYGALTTKGFASADITAALDNALSRDEESGIEQTSRAGSSEEIEKFFQKYYRMQSGKGYTGRELKDRIIRNLLGRGYAWDAVNGIIKQNEELF